MSSLRKLSRRLDAWRSFHGIARSARTLAAAKALRWAAETERAAMHLAWARGLYRHVDADPEGADRLPILVGFGTDMGLCGRLNAVVADQMREEIARHEPRLVAIVGRRLAFEIGSTATHVELDAPASFEAALVLERTLRNLLADLAGPGGVELVLTLPARPNPDGTPRVETWDRFDPPLDQSADVDERLARPGAHLTPHAQMAARARALLTAGRISHAACVAAKSEANARLATMTRAIDASERRIREQEIHLRRIRQEAVTQDMLEILEGSASRVSSRPASA